MIIIIIIVDGNNGKKIVKNKSVSKLFFGQLVHRFILAK